MIQINQIKCPLDVDTTQLQPYIAKKCRISSEDVISYTILRQSIDARKDLCFIFSVLVETSKQKIILKRKDKDITLSAPTKALKFRQVYMPKRPIVVGFGPAGMFAALALAKAGCRPVVFERGKKVEDRIEDVNEFWKTGVLNPQSNVQFGEGGAGTFSDGKLTTRIKDERIRFILEQFVEAGAPEDILYQQHPHIGTDLLVHIVKKIRNQIIELGGEIHFEHQVTSLLIEDNKIYGVEVNQNQVLADDVIFAIGHSAIDTLKAVQAQGVQMQAKDFAVGVRIEHPQQWVNETQYKEYANHSALKSAEYRLTMRTSKGRGAYTFCMCPGGTVVAASSQEGQIVVNGMSESTRDKQNANSALLVQVKQSDLEDHLFAGVDYIEALERRAYAFANQTYHAPAQWAYEFLNEEGTPNLETSYPLPLTYINLRELFDSFVNESLEEALQDFDRKMPGFKNGLMIGVETRSSSAIRVPRDTDSFISTSTLGLYPCGEGVGYAGGIMSSAVDGIRCAQALLAKFR